MTTLSITIHVLKSNLSVTSSLISGKRKEPNPCLHNHAPIVMNHCTQTEVLVFIIFIVPDHK